MTRIEVARRYVQSQRGNFRELSERTGLSYHWLSKFAQGRFADPGASKIDALFAAMAPQGGAEEVVDRFPAQVASA